MAGIYDAAYWKNKLGLREHPEGGFFKEVYKSDGVIKKESLPARYSGDRHYSTSIYFLITSDNFSAFHKIKSDETWHFYYGSPLNLHILDKPGNYSLIKLGSNPENGEIFQFTVNNGDWFAAEVGENDSYSLAGCTVSPGFDYNDFELGKKNELIKLYPEHSEIIIKLASK